MKVKGYLSVVSLLVLAAGPAVAQQKKQDTTLPPGLETVQQANQKIMLLASSPASSTVAPDEYKLAAGDVIKVDVFDIPELSQQIRIDPNGYISMPLIPDRIHAAGLTTMQLGSEIADLLKSRGLVSHPQVSVFVVKEEGQPITVIGAVEHPMVYEAVRPTTLLEVLSAAGGLTDTAGYYVTITRSDANGKSQVQRVDLQKLIDQGDPKANVLLRGGDVVAVPKAGIVYVVGAVARPGGFVMQSENGQMTALKALALAGGTGSDAKPQEAVIIRRSGQGKASLEIPVNLKKVLSRKAQDVRLEANDILFVPTSTGKKVLAKAAEAALSMTTGIAVVRAGSF